MERLIGENDEYLVEVRDNVAKWFSEKYFKTLIDNGVFKVTADIKAELEAAKKKALEEALTEMKRNGWGGSSGVTTLKPEIVKLIEDAVLKAVDATLIKAVGDAHTKLIARVEKMMESNVKTYIEQKAGAIIRETVVPMLSEYTKHLQDMTAWYKNEVKTSKEGRNISLSL